MILIWEIPNKICETALKKANKVSRRILNMIFAVLFSCATTTFADDYAVYVTNRFELKYITPSIIIDENSTTGNYEVFSVNRFGLRHINPDNIVEKDDFSGSWRLYRVNDFGIKELFADKVAEEDITDGTVEVYYVNDLGLKNIHPSTIIENSGDETKLYSVNRYGVREVSPFEVIRKTGSEYKVFDVNQFGVPEIAPKRVIEKRDTLSVFGILLLPSVKKVRFDPNSSRIKQFLQIRDTAKTEQKSSDWIRSKPKGEE